MCSNMELEIELINLFNTDKDIYIYGAGVVGKRLYKVIETKRLEHKIKGFIISQKNKENFVCGKKIYNIGELANKEIKIFVAVGEAYQNEILCYLSKNGYKDIVDVYIYSFLNEKYIPKGLNRGVPQEIIIDINELMVMQFRQNVFLRYDILLYLDTFQREKKEKIMDFSKYINVNARLEICDSGEEIALALYSGVKNIKIKQNYDGEPCNCNIDWLKKRCSKEKVKEIEALLEELSIKWRQYFIGIIWPPANILGDTIIQEIQKSAEIGNVYELQIDSKEELKNFIWKIYNTDDTELSQIENKVQRMQQESVYNIKIIEFYLDNPHFYIKRYGHTISKYGIDMKREIRNKYYKRIHNYIFDIILHTTDNYYQSREIRKIMEKYIND
ncbi:MAG: hypothetical protein IKJ01_07330 [Lachnospiraceae bacterium]|nr:hypothetical protein [Lachnospiraceae bacterium]